MSDEVKAALITGILGLVAAIVAATLGKNWGEKNAVQQLFSQVTTVNGDNNTVTINSVDEFVAQYNKLLNENETLKAQNSQYFSDYTEQKNMNEDLESQLSKHPVISYKNMGLSIEGNIIPINMVESSVIINNRTYYSDEFINSLINPNSNITIQDDIMFIGKIIKEKSYLSNEWILDSSYVKEGDNATDTYGNTYSDALIFWHGDGRIIYSLNNQYSSFKCNISIKNNANMGMEGIFTIKADDVVIYTSPTLIKTTEPYDIDIPINNCSLLSIEYDTVGQYEFDCIISNAIVYN